MKYLHLIEVHYLKYLLMTVTYVHYDMDHVGLTNAVAIRYLTK
uniref:MBL fold metallo-hydrolase n=1 Tax=Schistosoma curassoni TaxID=6186 RepID=A0A183KBJ3_9TREM